VPASPFAEGLARVAHRAARAGLPLPAAGDWQAADGWLPAALILLTGGGLAAVLSVWARLAPGTLPAPGRLLPAACLLAIVDLAVAGSHALRPTGETTVWRWLTAAAAAIGAVVCDPAGAHARLWIPWLLTAGLLGLAMRAGETMAAALAATLHSLPRPRPVDWSEWTAARPETGAEPERVAGETPLCTAWRSSPR
jgi:hypothetical protein